ncbi:amidohydrolase family protein [Salinisphaera sp. SPP-AMP-43]|uniref:amidohydrolase family protein n=1 Tax=Salinisphaera sp. SPP-AMP-43 TaxID=3121288 RepID=UPI003C6DFED1
MPERIFQTHPAPEFALTDCHVHIGASDTGEIFYPELTVAEYQSLMAASGIERACIFAPLRADGYRQANQALAATAAQSDRTLLAFARLSSRAIPLTEPAPWLARRKIRRRLSRRPPDLADPAELDGFDGVKLLPHMDGVPNRDTLAAIDERRLPLLVHGGDFCGPAWIEKHLIAHTRGPVIIAHLGCFPCAEHHLRDAIAVAARHDHVYLDTSGAWHTEYLRYAVAHIPERIVFGSDAPLMHPWVGWQHVTRAVRDDKLLEHIGRGAAAEIFGPLTT